MKIRWSKMSQSDKEKADLFSEIRWMEDEYARCLRAFHQDPCPRLGAALIQIAAALRVAEKKEKAWEQA